MSVAKVLRLEEYRDRRQDRLKLAEALYGVDRSRQKVFDHLRAVAELSGADRVATVWVDEYGPGLAHPYVVLDILSDRPRRSFALQPLNSAWEIGVPGVHDGGEQPASSGPTTFAIALGSDGTRSWFLVAESVSPRPALSGDARDRIMFVAGECSAIVLHRDLDVTGRSTTTLGDEARFVGWPILKDIEGREEDEAEGWRIAQRFVVARLVRMFLDDDLVAPAERVEEQVARARAELDRDVGLELRERALWLDVLEAYRSGHLDSLAQTLVELAEMAEARDHWHGALELYSCAAEVAAATSAPVAAINAARLRGRLLRRRAAWEEATLWYEAALRIASAAKRDDLAARVLAGLAVIKRDLGNLPAARERLLEARDVAERSGDRDTLASVYTDLGGVEHFAGDSHAALTYGWRAVATYECRAAKMRGLASLAGALGEFGDRAAAEDAWTAVAYGSDELYYRIYAHDALAHLAALCGDGKVFDEQAALCDALGWEEGPASAKAEILYYRGLGCRALGRFEDAERWLERAVGFAESHAFNRIMFDAEEALRSLSSWIEERPAPAPAAPPDVREGVRALRRELAGV